MVDVEAGEGALAAVGHLGQGDAPVIVAIGAVEAALFARPLVGRRRLRRSNVARSSLGHLGHLGRRRRRDDRLATLLRAAGPQKDARPGEQQRRARPSTEAQDIAPVHSPKSITN